VLLQLPFQPVLRYQWGVALAALALQLYCQVADFYTLVYPKKLNLAVERLRNMCDCLRITAEYFLTNFLIGCLSEKSKEDYQFYSPKNLLDYYPKVLPVIKFVTSDKCSDIIKALKRHAWNSSTKYSDKNMRFIHSDRIF